ncbi:uncharacterized protein [Rutidosis leptorrhynchoides]|uniref:uncharacterized protein isoform X2 n=1 Tax=Rutidosis leptorrhynchoides TaxID=125765 RepID=UPI003A98F6FE
MTSLIVVKQEYFSCVMAEYEGINSSNDHGNEGTIPCQKYGGLAPKKKPLISKDHERAFFDSADWALCKQGAGVNEKSARVIETLQPKLQKTPRERLPPRQPACVSRQDSYAD